MVGRETPRKPRTAGPRAPCGRNNPRPRPTALSYKGLPNHSTSVPHLLRRVYRHVRGLENPPVTSGKLPPMADTTNKGGRPSAEALRQRQIEEILDRHADGEALAPAPRTFRGWVRKAQEKRARTRGGPECEGTYDLRLSTQETLCAASGVLPVSCAVGYRPAIKAVTV